MNEFFIFEAKYAICVVLLCFRLLAELSTPLFVPDTVSLDRKHILEDIENKYREFITATLRCLSELKRELCECPMGDTCSPHLQDFQRALKQDQLDL